MATDIFLLPHQDDEFAAFAEIEAAIAAGRQVKCFILTLGGRDPAVASIRNQETVNVLLSLQVRRQDICFPGTKLRVLDQALQIRLFDLYQELAANHAVWTADARIFVTTWEGGHPDHDAAALLALALAQILPEPLPVFGLPTYNSDRCTFFPFRVLQTVKSHKSEDAVQTEWLRAINHAALCLSYKSQWRTWMFLAPFVFWRAIFRGRREMVRLDVPLCSRRPHEGRLLYEKRRWCRYSDFEADVADFRRQILASPRASISL